MVADVFVFWAKSHVSYFSSIHCCVGAMSLKNAKLSGTEMFTFFFFLTTEFQVGRTELCSSKRNQHAHFLGEKGQRVQG